MLNFLTFILYIYIYICVCVCVCVCLLLQAKDVVAMTIALFVDSSFWFTNGSVFKSRDFDVIIAKKFCCNNLLQKFFVAITYCNEKFHCNRAWWIEWFSPKSPPWPTCCNKICFVIIYFSYFLILGLFSNFRLQWPLPFLWILSFGLQKS